MKEHRWAVACMVLLLVVGASCIIARTLASGHGAVARGQKLWRLTYRLSLESDKPKVKLRAVLPATYRACRLTRESFSSSSLVMDVVRDKTTGQRQVVAVLRRPAKIGQLDAQFDILVSHKHSSSPPRTSLSVEQRARHLQLDSKMLAQKARLVKQVAKLSKGNISREYLRERIFALCRRPEEQDHDDESAPDSAILAKARASTVERARTMVALCRVAKIPARLVAGFLLQADEDAQVHVWLEVHDETTWVPYDPEYGYARQLPAHYLRVRRGDTTVAEVPGNGKSHARFSIRPVETAEGASPGQSNGVPAVLDLTRLPLGMQQTLALLLLLPAGALITAFWRNIVGLQTFGTFTPSLLALTFLYSDWRSGLVVFVLVMIVGLGGRALLDRMKLLMVPRLGAILTLVVLCLALAVSVLDHLGLTPSARAVILPLVILTMMIERFYIRSEEDSPASALKLLLMTFALAGVCLLVLRWEALGLLVVRYPEMEFFLLAAMLGIGRYSGYRLTELVRFRDLVKTTDGGKGKGDA